MNQYKIDKEVKDSFYWAHRKLRKSLCVFIHRLFRPIILIARKEKP